MIVSKRGFAMNYRVEHNFTGYYAGWYLLENYSDVNKAMHRARNFTLDNGGYVSVIDSNGIVVYGSNKQDLLRFKGK